MLLIDDISVRVAGKLLLDGASATIPSGARVGLVGRNGVGKTTLFRAIAGDVALELMRLVGGAKGPPGQDPQGALAALQQLTLPADNQRLRAQAGILTADALVAAGRPDSARAVLQALVTEFPMSRRLKDRLAQLGG